VSAFVRLDHVQLAMPIGGEAKARAFYCEVLGMQEVPKPPALAARGGLWLQSGGVAIHLGVEADFRPARKAHPALVCASYDALVAKLRAAGVEVREDREIAGVERCHIADVFGNRIELIAAR
jgi:catechol 2,3-dioxygenase-like lactoylglutathione lyase family enzyme